MLLLLLLYLPGVAAITGPTAAPTASRLRTSQFRRRTVQLAAVADVALEVSPEEELAAAETSRRKSENQQIVGLAGPALLGTLIDPFLSLVDTLYVGRIGLASSSVALGAVAAASELFTLCLAVSLALREASSSTLARLFAEGKAEEAATFAARSLLCARVECGYGSLIASYTRASSAHHPGLHATPTSPSRSATPPHPPRRAELAFGAGTLLAILFGGPSAPACVGLMGAPAGSPLHADALLYARVRALALPMAIALPAAEGIFRG
eukprot:6414009-Prymnesium_polylepis.1